MIRAYKLRADAHGNDGSMVPDEAPAEWDGTLAGAVEHGERTRRRVGEAETKGAVENDPTRSAWHVEVRVGRAAEPLVQVESDGRWRAVAGCVRRVPHDTDTLREALAALRAATHGVEGSPPAMGAAARAAALAYGLDVRTHEQDTEIDVRQRDGDELRAAGSRWWNGQLWSAARAARKVQRAATTSRR